MSTDLTVAMPQVHGPLSLALHVRADSPGSRFPIAAGLELTFRCNLACIHCYVNLPAADREAAGGLVQHQRRDGQAAARRARARGSASQSRALIRILPIG